MDIKDQFIASEIKNKKPLVLKFAPFWKRGASFLIDFIIINIIFEAIFIAAFYKEFLTINESISKALDYNAALKIINVFSQRHSYQIFIAFCTIFIAYFTLSWRASGQTIGARIMKIIVITIEKKRVGIIQSFIKAVILTALSLPIPVPLPLPLLLVLLIPIINYTFHQRLHDFISATVVVVIPEIELPGAGNESA